MQLNLIVACGQKNEIGKDNQLLWHLPCDLKNFKHLTSGHGMLMGRKTYDSIGKPLPLRESIVVTRKQQYLKDAFSVSHLHYVASLEEGIERAKKMQLKQLFVIGGASIYEQMLPLVDRIFLTSVSAQFPEADTFMPPIPFGQFELIKESKFLQDEKHPFPFCFQEWLRK